MSLDFRNSYCVNKVSIDDGGKGQFCLIKHEICNARLFEVPFSYNVSICKIISCDTDEFLQEFY